jgi:hypothetical protein
MDRHGLHPLGKVGRLLLDGRPESLRVHLGTRQILETDSE